MINGTLTPKKGCDTQQDNKYIDHMKRWIEATCEGIEGEEIGVWVKGKNADLWPVGFKRSASCFSWGTTEKSVMFSMDRNGNVVFERDSNRALYFLYCADNDQEFIEADFRNSTPFPPTQDNVNKVLLDSRLWESRVRGTRVRLHTQEGLITKDDISNVGIAILLIVLLCLLAHWEIHG